jgi:hypothetical protein
MVLPKPVKLAPVAYDLASVRLDQNPVLVEEVRAGDDVSVLLRCDEGGDGEKQRDSLKSKPKEHFDFEAGP